MPDQVRGYKVGWLKGNLLALVNQQLDDEHDIWQFPVDAHEIMVPLSMEIFSKLRPLWVANLVTWVCVTLDNDYCYWRILVLVTLVSIIYLIMVVRSLNLNKWKCWSCLSLCDPVDYSPPGSCVHGILQARILEWVSIPFPRRSSWARDWTPVSPISGRFFTIWGTRKTPNLSKTCLLYLLYLLT